MEDPEAPGIYLAGPSGFTEPGRNFHFGLLRPAVEAAGFRPLDPWEPPVELIELFLTPPGPDRLERVREGNQHAGARNARLIDEAAAVLALLDGVDVDSGTAAEIGYAAARGVPIVGLRTDVRPSGDNEATVVNLQVQWFIETTGGAIHSALGDAIEAISALVAATS